MVSIKQVVLICSFISIVLTGMALSGLFEEEHLRNSPYIIEVFQSDENGFGFNILSDNQVIIHQPSIPAVEGNNGFDSEMKAMQVAGLVVRKLNEGHFPPSVSVTELDSLGVFIR